MKTPFDDIAKLGPSDAQVQALVFAIFAVLVLSIVPVARRYAVPVGAFIMVAWLLKYYRQE